MWFDLAAGWRKYNASLAVWGLRSWPLFGVESQPLLGVSKRIAGIGRDSVPSSLAVVESLTASRSPVVGRFDCICNTFVYKAPLLALWSFLLADL